MSVFTFSGLLPQWGQAVHQCSLIILHSVLKEHICLNRPCIPERISESERTRTSSGQASPGQAFHATKN